MNLGESEHNLIQVQKWRAVDKRVSFEPAPPFRACNSCGSRETRESLVLLRIDRFDFVRCVASVALDQL